MSEHEAQNDDGLDSLRALLEDRLAIGETLSALRQCMKDHNGDSSRRMDVIEKAIVALREAEERRAVAAELHLETQQLILKEQREAALAEAEKVQLAAQQEAAAAEIKATEDKKRWLQVASWVAGFLGLLQLVLSFFRDLTGAP